MSRSIFVTRDGNAAATDRADKGRRMAWIRMIRENEATDRLKTYYDKYGSRPGGVDNILRIHSLNPDSLKYHYDMYKHLMAGPSGLSRAQREMIGTVTSKINGCHY